MFKYFFLPILIAFNCAIAADLEYFKDSYEESDSHFNLIFNRFKSQNPKAEVYQFLYPQGIIKGYFIPSKSEQKNLLVMISGTHGIEAFAGSAVQRYFLDQKFNNEHTALLMIHGFNLWGFKNFRRVNENNIDLNRNFVLDRNHFKPDDSMYGLLNTFLNPEGSPSAGVFSQAWFIAKALYQISVHSIETLRVSILKGQYSFEKGIFYGGKEGQEQELLLNQLINRYFNPYKKVFIIDLHTGYGEKGKLHLLAGKTNDPNSIALKKIFSENEIDFSDKKKFYAVEGELLTYFGHQIVKNTQAEVVGVTFEYGTLDSQKTLGSIESLRRMILENQNYHFPASPNESSRVKNLFQEMFYPSDPIWRESVLNQSSDKLMKIMQYLHE